MRLLAAHFYHLKIFEKDYFVREFHFFAFKKISHCLRLLQLARKKIA